MVLVVLVVLVVVVLVVVVVVDRKAVPPPALFVRSQAASVPPNGQGHAARTQYSLGAKVLAFQRQYSSV